MYKPHHTALIFTLVLILLCAPISAPALTKQRARVDIIVRGGTIVTMDGERRVINEGALAVRDGRIAAVGSRAEIESSYNSKEIIEARGRIVVPGLINGHTHIPMTLFRGLADDLELSEWLTKYIFPAEAKNVTEEFVRAGTQLGLAEMIRGGTTTYCDMYYFEDAIADETARAGVRGVLGETIIDFPVPDNKTNIEAMAYVRRFVDKWRGHKLITAALAPHAPYTVSEEHLRAVQALSVQRNAPVVIHVAETRKEVADIQASKGARPVAYLNRIGFLNSRVIAAHVVYADAEEIKLLRQAGVGVVHNPQSNMKLASGVAPVPQMLAEGVHVGLGTDGAASNNDLDMWEEIDTVAKLHKVTSFDPRVIPARVAFEMATINGARALHLENETGSLEAGKRADFVVLDSDELHQTPNYDIYSQLVYTTKAADVLTVCIEGRIVMRDRRLLTLDEVKIKERARFFRERIVRSLALRRTPESQNAFVRVDRTR
ncbi:MAG: amidohydrolase [Pyrinomonadaceae bacterium]|nr:amidohydrolase [Pyrinomonadaceae bacterium]